MCGRSVVEKLVELGRTHEEFRIYSLLFLFAYVFLLRLPSEALPLAVIGTDGQSILSIVEDKVVLTLKRRSALHKAACSLHLVYVHLGKTGRQAADSSEAAGVLSLRLGMRSFC